MNRIKKFVILFLFLIIILAGCGQSEEEIATHIAASAEETVAALPTATPYPTSTPYPTFTPFPDLPTATPYPTLTPYPTPTAISTNLEGLYCNFDFCIGYPQDPIAAIPDYARSFIDEIVGDLNTFEEGGYSWLTNDVLIFMNWYVQRTDSPKEHVENALDDPDYTDVGVVTEATINNLEVAYAPYQATDSTVPYRLFTVWRCGDRLFSYSIRSEEDVDLMPLLEKALNRFTCSEAAE